MIKKNKHIIHLLLLIFLAILSACEDEPMGKRLLEESDFTIYELLSQQENYSKFVQILDNASLKSALSSYGSYSLFCPSNDAIDRYISSSNYNSFQELLDDTDYLNTMARYHLVMNAYVMEDFGYGALPDTTANGDQLTVSFSSGNTSQIFINGFLLEAYDQMSNNGVIHTINGVLTPIIYDSYEFIKQKGGYDIFCEALIKTGLRDSMYETKINSLGINVPNRYTLLAEPDTMLNRFGFDDYDDYKNTITTEDNITSPENDFYQYIAFHILENSISLNEFESGNYNTFGNEIMAIVSSSSIWFNSWVIIVQDTIWNEIKDSIISINEVVVNMGAEPHYINSNFISKNGVIHTVTNMMHAHTPELSNKTFNIAMLPEFNEMRSIAKNKGGDESFIVFPYSSDMVERLNWITDDGTVTHYIKDLNGGSNANNGGNNLIVFNGLFTTEYTTNKILKGNYKIKIKVGDKSDKNAIIQCYIDGIKLGIEHDWGKNDRTSDPTLFNLQANGSNNFFVGEIEFEETSTHKFKIEAYLPGEMQWCSLVFVPN